MTKTAKDEMQRHYNRSAFHATCLTFFLKICGHLGHLLLGFLLLTNWLL